jgi:hypothetical protein
MADNDDTTTTTEVFEKILEKLNDIENILRELKFHIFYNMDRS